MLLEVSLNLALDEPLKIGIDSGVDPPGAIAATREKRVDEMRRLPGASSIAARATIGRSS